MARLAFILVLCVSAVAHADARRFALIVGANSGGPARTPLRYAESDAAAFASLLLALGGVTAEDKLTLVEPSRAQFETAIEQLRTRMADRGAATRIELVVYYSGHSDEAGLMLGTDRVSYDEFRGALQTLPADVRIAILDSCQSGALTRRKGGTMRPPFLLDTSSSVRGQAILTSSSETESAQESDRIRGSFFTHYLLSGLRGAADVSHDRRVTLNEAYQFAFAETLARTEGTKFGPQHPGYEIELAGSGDVVMTDLRATPSSLTIDENVVGRVFLRDMEGTLVAELYKAPGRTVEIGLSPGTYAVRVESKERNLAGNVQIADGAHVVLEPSALHEGVLEVAQRRGGDDGDPPEQTGDSMTVTLTPAKKERHVPIAVNLWPGAPPWPAQDEILTENLVVNFAYGIVDHVRGIDLSIGGSRVRQSMRGLQLSGVFSLNDGGGEGVQASGVFGSSGGEFKGIEFAGVAQVDHGDRRGITAAGAVVYNDANGMAHGITMAGAFAREGEVQGIEAAGAFSMAESLTGLQMAGGLNLVNGDVNGLQLSVINIGGNVRGAQIGVINIAQVVHGTQIGVINVSKDMYGVPVGLFSYIQSAGLGADVWSSGTEPLNVALRYDPHHTFYSFLAFGMMAFDDLGHGDAYAGLGLGAHVAKVGKFGVDLDAMAADPYLSFAHDKSDFLVRERVSAVYEIAPHFSVFAGVSYSQYMGWSHQDNKDINTGFLSTVHHSANGDFTLRMWPQVFAGIRI